MNYPSSSGTIYWKRRCFRSIWTKEERSDITVNVKLIQGEEKRKEEASRLVKDNLYLERTDSLTQEAMRQLHDSGNRSRLPIPPARHVIRQRTLISGKRCSEEGAAHM
jgi:hypothetical protein